GLAAVAARLDPKQAAQVAATLTQAMAKTIDSDALDALAQGLSVTLIGVDPTEMSRRFSTQQLVDLLKQPTCIGRARRLILDQLENRYRQKFTDHWDFVRFAEKQKLGLDLTSPPRRPTGPPNLPKK